MKKQLMTGMLVASLAMGGLFAQGAKKADGKMAPAAPAGATAAPAKAAKAAPKGATAAEIEDAKKQGLVWVNTDSKVYHKGGRYFGKTKEGKFMSEADAKKAGFTGAKAEIGEKKPEAKSGGKMEAKAPAKK